MKRIIAMLLAIVMLVGNIPVQAFATQSEPEETTACITEGCTYGAGHTGECSTFVACGKDGCTFAAGHEGNCSNYAAPEEPKAEPAADAAVYVTVSDRGELGMAYEEVTVTDINADGKLSVDEALYAAHTVYGKGYASENGTVTKLWDVETANVSFFVNHEVISMDVNAETVSSGDYLVASVDQDAVNDYDKYSRFDVLETSVKAGEEFTLTLTDDAGNVLAGMEIGLSNGNGSTTMTGLTTDVNGAVTLTLDQEGLYCVTAKGTVVESSIDVNTMEITSIETPIIAPVCVVIVSGNAVPEVSNAESESVTWSMNPAAKTAVVTDADGSNDVNIYFSVVDAEKGDFIVSRQPMTVSPGTGAAYGWMNDATGETMWETSYDHSVEENECTPLDALILAHELMYGDDFNEDTINTYLAGDADYIQGFFQRTSSTGVSFRINGKAPTDPDGCSYASNEYVLQNNDELVFLTYTTFDFTSDVFAYFTDTNGYKVNELTVEAEQPVSLVLKGLAADQDPMNWGVEHEVGIASVGILQASPKEDGFGLNLAGTALTTTVEDGTFTYTFNTAGEYYLSAKGPYKDENGMDHNLTMPLCKITVTAPACQHTDTETNYVPVAGQTKHTVIVICTACKEKAQQDKEEDCTDENGDNTCDSCKVALPVAVESIILKQGENLLNADSIIPLKMGETATLTATVSPENAAYDEIIWRSENTAVATVSGGVITPVAEGSTTIKVTAGGKEAACTVEVKPAVVAVESVTVVPETAQVEVGQTVELAATVLPETATDKTVIWSSSDDTIATVDVNGLVTGVKAGSATITATTTDGGKKAACTVTVTQPVTGITLSQSTAELKVNETVTLTAEVAPADATDKTVTWSAEPSSAVEIESSIVDGVPTAVVTAKETGSVTITASAGDKTATCTVTVTEAQQEEPFAGIDIVTGDTATGMKEIRISNIHIGAAGSIDSNTISSDGNATVSITGDVETLDIKLELIASNKITIKKGYVSFNDEAATVGQNIDETNSTAEWSKTITPDWAAGNAILKFTVGNSDSLTESKVYTLTLKKAGNTPATEAVESVTVAPETAEVEVCQTVELAATVLPENATDKTVTWTSGDETIATVDQFGKVTGVASGTVTITATANNGVFATCTVIVTEAQQETPSSNAIVIVTEDVANDNKDARATKIQIDTTGDIYSNTIKDDGKVTVFTEGTPRTINLTLNLISGKMARNGTNVQVGDGELTKVEMDSETYTGTFTTEVTLDWIDDVATVHFTVGLYNKKFINAKEYTLTLQKKGYTSNNADPAIADNAETTASVGQYSWYELDLGTIFDDAETEDNKLVYQVYTNGAWMTTDQNYRYLVKTYGTTELKFKAKDAVGADSPEHTITLTISQYQAPEHGLLIGNVTDNGVLKSLTIQDASSNVLPVEFEVSGQEITVYLPGDQVGGNDTVKAVFDLEQVNGLPFLSRYYQASSAKKDRLNVFETQLNSYSGSVTAYYWTEEPGTAENRNGYTINYQKLVGENYAPALADGVEATVTDSIAQYQTWSVDLSKIFTEPDEEAMSYTVSVNNGAAQDTDASYSYDCNESGTVTFVFTAADPSGLTATYKVTLTVTHVPRTVVSTELTNETANGVFCKGIQVTGYTLNSRVTHYAADQHKITFLLQYAEKNASAELEFLSDFQSVMYYYASQSGEPTLELSEKVNGPYTVTLENGEKILYLATTTAAKNERQDYQLIFRNQNNAPAPVNTTYSDTCTVQVPCKFDLSDKFSDQNNDPLDYYVSVNGDDKQMIDAQWEYTAGTTGVHTLVFIASDGFVDSEPYTVTLNAELSEDVYTVNVKLSEAVTPAFYITDSVSGENGDVLGNALNAMPGETADGWTTYQVIIPDNISRISIRGTTTENEETVNWGGMSIVTKDADGNAITDTVVLRQVKGVIDSQFNGAAPASTDAKFVIQTQDGEYPVSGNAYEEGGYLTYRYLLVAQEGYTYSTVATGSLAEKYGTKVSESTYSLTTDEAAPAILKLFIDLKNGMYVTVPQGSVVHTGKMRNYFKYYFFDEYYRMEENQDSTVTYIFEVPAKANPDGTLGGEEFIRVQHPSGVTYWTYDDTVLTAGGKLTLTEDDLFIGSSFNSKSIIHDLSEIPTDVADIYLSVNKQMYVNLNQGDSYKLNVFRNWQAIEGMTNEKTALPDVHYAVIDTNGNPSNVVTVTTDDFNSSVATIKANTAGTAIVLVTYDAMYSTQVCKDAMGYSGKAAKLSAIWPENTGVFVVTVGADGSSIVTNIDVDAEHDPIYYVGNAGAEYSFTPESGCTVSVARAIVGTNSLTYGGFSTSGVTVDSETGEVTVTGLQQGRHIIRVEKGGVATYQVVTTKQTSYTITDTQGNVITDKTPVLPGTKLTIQFGDLYNPVNKLAGVYNSNCALYYKGEDETVFEGSNGDTVFGFYVFAAAPDLHKVTVTVPSDWTGDTYTLEGSFKIGGFGGGGGGHRGILLYETGRNVNHEAEGASGNPGVLPEITIKVAREIPATGITVKPTSLDMIVDETAELVAEVEPFNSTDSVEWKSSNTAIATVSEEGTVTAIAVGEVTITATAGKMTAECAVKVNPIPYSDATVYFSVSHDANFLKMDGTNKVVALQKLTVPYFDLALYGLEQYKVEKTNAAYGKPTMLHLYLYATEIFQFGIPEAQAGQGYLYKNNKLGTDVLTITGDPGSLFMKKFWGMNENLNYYHNYEYPADQTGYGMTADEVVLENGDIVTIGHFTSWSFHDDPRSVFNYLVAGEDKVETTAVQNQEITLKLYLAGANLGKGSSNSPIQEVQNIYYTKADALSSGDVTTWTLLGTTDDKGELKVAMPETGKYILAVPGQKGTKYTNVIVSTPGGIVLTVNESGADDPVKHVIGLIDAIDESLDADAIADAREAYNALSSVLQKNVINYSRLTEAEDALAVKQVEDLIEAIGTPTPDSRAAIEAARAAYDALDGSLKEQVDNYTELLKAEKYLSLLDVSDEQIADIYWTTGTYLNNLGSPTVGSINGEWRVIGLTRTEYSVPDSYYDAVVDYVKTTIAELKKDDPAIPEGRLNAGKSTDNSRIILALTAIGKDVTDVDGHNLLSGLNEMAYIGNQGINGYIWALIAFDSHDYEIPAGDVSRQALIEAILDAQLPDGGWTLSGNAADSDMTGMALQALAPYYNSDKDVKDAVDKALSWVSDTQNDDGTFSTGGTPTAESIAQIITGLTALGINPEEDTRFVKNGISAVKALANFYVEGGGFKKGTEFNMMSTEQGYYALVSYFRLLEAKNSLYDMSDVTIETSAANQAAANEVIALINAIGTVDLTKEDEIKAARDAYNALTDAQKALISDSTYKILTDAETALAQLQQTSVDTAAANNVKNLIDAIGTVTLDKENAITSARNAYNRLTTLQKNLVGATYLTKLTAAEAELAALKKAAADEAAASAVEQKISNIGTNITLGSESKITTARNAYNALTADQKALVSNYQTLVNAEAVLNTLKSTVSVTFSLLGCYKHGTNETSVHTLAGGNLQTWIAAKTYKVKPGATVKDLFEQALTAAGMTWSNPSGNYIESITKNGVKIGEFTNGKNSGWMYTLNGKHPGLGVAQQTLVNGDKVVFHYTDDYTKEEGSTSGSTTGTNTGTSTGTVSGSTNYITTTTTTVNTETAESVDRLIEDIGEEITLDSEAKILAARAAYDKLTEAQKKLVEKYDVLVAAEAKLAELKGASGESENAYIVTGDYLQGLGTPGVGAIGGEWMVIGLARSGRPVPSGYYDHVLNYVRENINDAEQLHSAKSSDNSRLILALTAIGKDVTNVDGHDLLKGLNDMDYIQKQGINGPIWALLAFDSGNYPVPEGNVSREALIDVILEAQLSDGGWALSGERSDPDMTGMAIQALAPYMESNMDVKKAVEEAIWTLSEIQNDNGSFSSVDGPNSESIAQVIVALAALGIDADTDARFVKNGISAMDALLTYYIPGGGFRHILDGNLDGMSTEQAYYALVAYNRMKQNQKFLYDMTDVIDAGGDVILEETTEPTEAPTELVEEEEEDNGNNVVIWTGVMSICAAAIAVLLLNRKKLFGKF